MNMLSFRQLSTNQVHDQAASPLFRYPFLFSLMLVYFTDHSMFTRLLITCKAIKQYARHYRMKSSMCSDQSVTLMDKY
jgi:hypothetical protein